MSTQGRETYDKPRFTINVARIRKGGKNFEVVIDADQAVAFRNGARIQIHDIVKSQEIFIDAKKGELAQHSLFKELFGTEDPIEVARQILMEGEIQLTAEYRQKLRDAKLRQILSIIHRNGVDPRTNLPHPMTRLENALEQVHLKIDEFRSAEDQVKDVLEKLRPVLPVKFAVVELSLTIPAAQAAKSYTTVKSFSTILKEDWRTDGSWAALVELPAGLQDEMLDELNKVTHGNIDARVMRTR